MIAVITKELVLGVDIGGVINDTSKVLWSDGHLSIPIMEGAFESLYRLGQEKYGENIFVVSNCPDLVQANTEEWLAYNKFCERTGIKKENILFCRYGSYKMDICRSRSITTFIDNRKEVINHLKKQVPNLHLFRPEEDELFRHGGLEENSCFKIRQSWEEVLQAELS